jgi:hypothetical protein
MSYDILNKLDSFLAKGKEGPESDPVDQDPFNASANQFKDLLESDDQSQDVNKNAIKMDSAEFYLTAKEDVIGIGNIKIEDNACISATLGAPSLLMSTSCPCPPEKDNGLKRFRRNYETAVTKKKSHFHNMKVFVLIDSVTS